MAKIKIIESIECWYEDVEQPELSEHAAVGTVLVQPLFGLVSLTETGQMLTNPA